MTQYYALPKFSLFKSKPSVKALITLFLIGTLAAMWLSVYTMHHRSGLTVDGLTRYYLGNESDPNATEMMMAKSSNEMLEFFHIHSFTLLLLMFILCHFAALTTVGEALKIGYFIATFFAYGGMMTLPWGVRFCANPKIWAAGSIGAGAAFVALTFAGAAAVLWESWVGPLGNGRTPGPETTTMEVN